MREATAAGTRAGGREGFRFEGSSGCAVWKGGAQVVLLGMVLDHVAIKWTKSCVPESAPADSRHG